MRSTRCQAQAKGSSGPRDVSLRIRSEFGDTAAWMDTGPCSGTCGREPPCEPRLSAQSVRA